MIDTTYFTTNCSSCGKETWWAIALTQKPLCTECWDKKCDATPTQKRLEQQAYRQRHREEIRATKRDYKRKIAQEKKRWQTLSPPMPI